MKITQSLLTLILETPLSGAYGKIRFRSLLFFRNILINVMHDPAIFYDVFGSKILMPLSHDLPLIMKRYPQYATNIGRIAKFVRKKYPDLTFVDIGANIGDTAAILRSEAYFPILCIDGNEEFFRYLEINSAQWPDVYSVKAFIGDHPVPWRGKLEARSGTCHLVPDASSPREVIFSKLSDILNENPIFRSSKMIKIDTDGLDCKILKGELEFLERAIPVIFFEYAPYFFSQFEDDGF